MSGNCWLQTNLMHFKRLRKRQRLSNKPSEVLTQGVVPALDMSRLSTRLSHRPMVFLINNGGIRGPKIGITHRRLEPLRDPFPKTTTGFLATITHGIGDDLTRVTAQYHPHPDVVCFAVHIRPQFVNLQNRRVRRCGRLPRIGQCRQSLGFFLANGSAYDD